MTVALRELQPGELRGPFESIAQLRRDTRPALEAAGARFAETYEPSQPGPLQTAEVALADGSQYMLVHHYGHPDSFLELRGQLTRGTPPALLNAFLSAVQVPEGALVWSADAWPSL